ncbi:MAG: hypothetical protein JXQ30_15605 [Spirochaetes bacterium]|nr:hypothetical protein [Spirochaetota bacterium]
MITSYGFGMVAVDRKVYTSDVIIYPEETKDGWWRKKGHELSKDDIQEILEYRPRLLIVGTGKFGLMKVPEEVASAIRASGIELVVARTPRAVRLFNEAPPGTRAVAALHLTC